MTPVLVLVILINMAVGYVLFTTHASFLRNLTASPHAQLENRLEAEAARLRVLGALPSTEARLAAAERAQRSALQRGEEIAETRRTWAGLSRDDMRVREVLDNNVGEMFQRLCARDERVSRILLTDAFGVIVASSEKPPLYDYQAERWWVLAATNVSRTVVSEGLDADNQLELAMAIGPSPEARVSRGVLRADLVVEHLLEGLGNQRMPDETAVFLVGRGAALVAGSHDLLDRVGADLAKALEKDPTPGGWLKGVRYLATRLGGGVSWNQPAWVVAVRREGLIPFSVYGFMSLFVLASALFVISWDRYSRGSFRASIVNPHADLLEAGDWILRTALGRPSVMAPPPDVRTGRSKPAVAEPSPVQRELQAWLHRLLQDLHDEYTTHTSEMQRDLNLARDFQQAYLDRPYPKIPVVHVEGRLRLDFSHRYEPALALGGDFYNIITLAPDCAGVYIADVMGHGTRSALITAIIRTLIDDLTPQGRNARHFLTEMNKLFCGLLKSVPNPLFASAFYFVADTTARVATYSSAGHPAPFHVRRSMGRISRLEVPMPRGSALGLLPNEQYTGGYCRLVDGDIFLFFTDGVYEARNAQGEEFGIARMEKVIQKLMYRSVKDIVDGLSEAISGFVGYEPISDDICMVAIEVTTKPASAT
jgi:phosphoserine phosphatase RsbU/P